MSRILPFLVFLLIAFGLVGGLHYYVWARLIRDPQLPQSAARLLTGALVVLAVAMPLSLIAARALPGVQLRPLLWVVFIWMGVGFLLAAFIGLSDAGRLVAFIARRSLGSAPLAPERRLFLARTLAAGVSAGVAGLSVLGLRSALAGIQIKQLDIALRGLPADLDGFRLVQISDVHIGPLLRKDWLAHVVARIVALKPDAVAITGDLVDGSVAELREQVQPLSDLRAPRGTFFVTGNHEYYSGAQEWLAHLPTLGVRPLQNERVELAPGLDLAGIPDPTAHGLGAPHAPDLDRALAGRDRSRPVVLLAHQPRQFLEAAEKEVSLTLSGHTHGGQIWPFSWLVALAQPYLAGLHTRGASQLYVSRGTGFWGPPLRVFAPAEITLFTLRPARPRPA